MTAVQRDEAWLKTATPAQIADAHEAGQLNALLGYGTTKNRPAVVAVPQLSVGQLQSMTSPAIAQAYAEGRLASVLGDGST